MTVKKQKKINCPKRLQFFLVFTFIFWFFIILPLLIIIMFTSQLSRTLFTFLFITLSFTCPFLSLKIFLSCIPYHIHGNILSPRTYFAFCPHFILLNDPAFSSLASGYWQGNHQAWEKKWGEGSDVTTQWIHLSHSSHRLAASSLSYATVWPFSCFSLT